MIGLRVHSLRYAQISTFSNIKLQLIAGSTVIGTINDRRQLHVAVQPGATVDRKRVPLQMNSFILPAVFGTRFASVDSSAGLTGKPEDLALHTNSSIQDTATSLSSEPAVLEATKTVIDLSTIPEAPATPTILDTVSVETVNAAGEATFASIGLGGWSPVGIFQNCMEFLHIDCTLPWWLCIAIGTVMVRTLLFPLVVIAQRNAAKMNNYMPQMQVLQLKMSEARQMGNALESARYAQEMVLFMKEKDLNPLKNFVVPLAQAPIFISFFMGLRAMANTPVESMRDGGLFWFTDLTVADPYFLLPVITSATLSLTIEIGTDSARLTAQNLNTMRYVLRALPVVIFPFTMNFPAAILTYWACSNFVSLLQVAVLKMPAIRDYFKIERLVTHKAEELQPKKGFVSGIKDSWQNMKITREVEDRQRLDEIRFEKAGHGPIVKTYKYDPTKKSPVSQSSQIAAKKKEN